MNRKTASINDDLPAADEDAAVRTGQVEVFALTAPAVVDPPAVKLFHLSVEIEQRARHAAAEVFVSTLTDDPDRFQTVADFRARFDLLGRKPQPERAVDEADPEPLDRFTVGDPTAFEILHR